VLFEVDTETLDPSLLGPDDVDLPNPVGEGWREMDCRATDKAMREILEVLLAREEAPGMR